MSMIKRLAAALALLVVCLALDAIALLWMTVALVSGSPRGWKLAIAHDQIGNALSGGDEDEEISSRAWRNQAEWPWRWLLPAIDWVAARFGDPEHCRKSFEKELLKAEIRAELMFSGHGPSSH